MAFVENFVPYLAGVGSSLVTFDEDSDGAEDFVGNCLLYAAEVVTAISLDEDVPPLPDFFLDEDGESKFFGSLSTGLRLTIQTVSAVLTIVQFQLAFSNRKASQVFRYINQVLRAVLAGKIVPEAPAELTT